MCQAHEEGPDSQKPEIRGSGRHPLPGAATVSKGASFRILGNFPDFRSATATRQTPGSGLPTAQYSSSMTTAGRTYRREAALHLGLLRRPVAVRVPLIGETVNAEQKLAFRSDRKLLSVGRVIQRMFRSPP